MPAALRWDSLRLGHERRPSGGSFGWRGRRRHRGTLRRRACGHRCGVRYLRAVDRVAIIPGFPGWIVDLVDALLRVAFDIEVREPNLPANLVAVLDRLHGCHDGIGLNVLGAAEDLETPAEQPCEREKDTGKRGLDKGEPALRILVETRSPRFFFRLANVDGVPCFQTKPEIVGHEVALAAHAATHGAWIPVVDHPGVEGTRHDSPRQGLIDVEAARAYSGSPCESPAADNRPRTQFART